MTDLKDNSSGLRQYAILQKMQERNAVSITDINGNITFVNDLFLERFQITSEEIIGKTHRAIGTELSDPEMFIKLWQTIEAGDVWVGVVKNRKKWGDIVWENLTISPIYEDDNIVGYISIREDITPRKKAEEEHAKISTLLEAVRNLQQEYLLTRYHRDIFQKLVNIIVKYTGSTYGYIGEVLINEKNQSPYLKVNAIAVADEDFESRKAFEQLSDFNAEFHNPKTLIGEVLKAKQIVVSNDPLNDKRSGGLPPNHPKLNSFLGIPLIVKDELVGSIGLANRPGGYGLDVINQLRLILDTCAILVSVYQKEKHVQFLEEEEKLNGQMLSLAIESMGDALWKWSVPDSKYYLSENWMYKFGYIPTEFKKDPQLYWDIIHPEDRQRIKKSLDNCINGETERYDEKLRMVKKDGQIIWVHGMGGVAKRNDMGRPEILAGVAIDITEDRIKDLAFQELSQKITSIIQNIEGHFIQRVDRDLQLMTLADESLKKLTGYSSEELKNLNKKFFDLISKEDHSKVLMSLHRALETEKKFEVQYRLINKKNEEVYLEEKGRVVDLKNGIPVIHSILFDISQQHKILNELEIERSRSFSNSKLSSMIDMASSLSLEINNPLTVIKGMAFRLGEQFKRKREIKNEETGLIYSALQQSAERIEKVVTSLQIFANPNAVDTVEEVNIYNLVENILIFARGKLHSKDIFVNTDEISKELNVFAAKVPLSQAILNLIHNSSDAVSELPEKWIKISAKLDNGGRVKIKIEDSGKGIPSVLREKIMLPFFSTKVETNNRVGLGLSNAKKIVENYGGQLYLESENKNTCFVIELPKFKNAA